MDKFSDGTQSAFVELPVKAAYLKWSRGNAQMKAIAESDPGLYFGGWRAFVTAMDGQELPTLPIPKVTRTSSDGQHDYVVYATNVLNFLPIQHRTRFELRQLAKDQETGRDYQKVIAVSPKRIEGYTPYRQIFGLVFSDDFELYAPGVVRVYTWSAFISFEKAGQVWNKVNVPSGKVLIRRYGNSGKDGRPEFETFGQGHSTPIRAIDSQRPHFFTITDELNELWDDSLAWKECERWNGSAEDVNEPASVAKKEFLEMCETFQLTNVEIEQVLAENNNNYADALAALRGPDLDEMNSEVAETDEFP